MRLKPRRPLDDATFSWPIGADWPSFSALVTAEWRQVFDAARRAGVPVGQCDDIALEVFLRFHRNAATIASPAAIRSWLRTTTLHVCREHFNQRITRHEVLSDTDDLEPTSLAPSPDQRLFAEETYDILLTCVAALEPDRRAVFQAYAMDEQPMADIARQLSIPEATAYNRLRLAREDIRAALERARLISDRGGEVPRARADRGQSTRKRGPPRVLLLPESPRESIEPPWISAFPPSRGALEKNLTPLSLFRNEIPSISPFPCEGAGTAQSPLRRGTFFCAAAVAPSSMPMLHGSLTPHPPLRTTVPTRMARSNRIPRGRSRATASNSPPVRAPPILFPEWGVNSRLTDPPFCRSRSGQPPANLPPPKPLRTIATHRCKFAHPPAAPPNPAHRRNAASRQCAPVIAARRGAPRA